MSVQHLHIAINNFEKLAKESSGAKKRTAIEKEQIKLIKKYKEESQELRKLLSDKEKLELQIAKLAPEVKQLGENIKNNYQALQTMDLTGAEGIVRHHDEVSYLKDNRPYSAQYADDGNVNLIPKHLRGRKSNSIKAREKDKEKEDQLDALDFAME